MAGAAFDGKARQTREKERFLNEDEHTANVSPALKYYVPVGIRTWFLVILCFFTLGIFILLQLAAAAYHGAPGLNAIVPRFAQLNCPPGATCAPAAGSWTNPNAPSTTTTQPYATPAPGSWTNPATTSSSVATAPPPGSYTNKGFSGWSQADYFVGSYLPTLVAIIFSIAWKCVFSRLKEMEPFYQLTKPGGARAADSLLLAYPGSSLAKVFFDSLRKRHPLAFFGSFNMLLVTLCTALAAETLYTTAAGSDCGVITDSATSSNNDCHFELAMRPWLAWFLGGVLFMIFALTVILIFRLRRRRSGIFAEATSIVGVAALQNSSTTQQLPTLSMNPTLKFALTGRHSSLDTNSIVSVLPAFADFPLHPQILTKRQKRSHAATHPASLAFSWLVHIGVLVLIIYYRFFSSVSPGNGFESFMDSQSFGVRLLMSVIGLGIKFHWSAIEAFVRRQTPYVALAAPQGASAESSVLVRSPSHPATALLHRSTWRAPLLALVTVAAVLSEVLVITLTAVPFSSATAYLDFKISVYICMVILGLMILVLPAVIVWRMAKRDATPDPPECIADVFAMLGPDIAARFGTLGKLSGKKRNRLVRSWRFRYCVRRLPQESKGLYGEWQIVTRDSAN